MTETTSPPTTTPPDDRPAPSAADQPQPGGFEPDFRFYADVIARHGRRVLLVAFAAAVLTFVLGSFGGHTYRATAGLLMLPVNALSSISTELRTEIPRAVTGPSARQETFMDIAMGGALARDVHAAMADRLGGVASSPEMLVASIMSVAIKGEMITVSAKTPDPQLSADLANRWARETESRINRLYSSSARAVANLEREIGRARAEHEKAQEELESFLRSSRLLHLGEKFEGREKLLLKLHQEIGVSLARVEAARLRAEGLEPVAAELASTPGGRLALSVALAGIARAASGGEGGLRIDAAAARVDPADLTRLKTALSAELTRLIAVARSAVSQAVATDLPAGREASPLLAFLDELRGLQAEVEKETGRRRELQIARDASFEALAVLLKKHAEMTSLQDVHGSEVKMATEALRPTVAVSRRRALNAAFAFAAALAIGLLWSMGGEMLRAVRR